MSSKSKQKSTIRNRSSAIHVDANSTANDSGSSPNTSNRWSRIHEKETLSNLNDRLASYIERVRTLESENARLYVQIRDVEVVEKKEKDDLANRYESKLNDIRKQFDQVTRDKAKLEIERTKAVDGYEELKKRNTKLEKDLKKAEHDLAINFKEVQDITARFNNVDNSRKIAENENYDLKKEVEDLKNQIDVLCRQLEDEVVLRTELENKLATYKEDLEFARRNHTNQIEELRRKRQIEMTSYSSEVETRYNHKLQEQIQSMRADFDNRIQASRAEVDDLYKNKLNEAVETANRQHASAQEAREEASRHRLLIHDLEAKLKGHDVKVDMLNRRIEDLEAALRRAQEEADIRIHQRDERIRDLENEAASLLNDYQDLLDVKVQLDTELQAYQKLIESEETRLQITPVPSPNSTQANASKNVTFDSTALTPSNIRRGMKRKHLEEENIYNFQQLSKSYISNSHSDVDVVIEEVDSEGKFIRLANKSENEVVLGKWVVKSVAGEKEVQFKFHSKQVIKGGKTISLWSNNSGHEHAAPVHIVMKNQTWPSGDAIRVDLIDSEGVIVAWRENILKGRGYHDYDFENGNDPDKRCGVM